MREDPRAVSPAGGMTESPGGPSADHRSHPRRPQTGMKVYHRAGSDQAAESIDRVGFQDGTGNYLTSTLHTGVWVADTPLDPNDYGHGQWDAPVVEMDVAELAIANFEWIEDGKPYREWLVPAADLNRCPRRRLSIDEEDDVKSA